MTDAGEQPHPVRHWAQGSAQTLRCALWNPSRLYGRPFSGVVDWRAMYFAMGVTALVPLAEQMLLHALLPLVNTIVPLPMLVLFLPPRLSAEELFRAVVLVPGMLPILLMVYAAVLHALLWLAESGERGYGVTLQCVCFCMGSMVFRLLPYGGGYVAAAWWLGMLAAGLHFGHGSPWRRVLPVVALHVAAFAWLLALAKGWVDRPPL